LNVHRILSEILKGDNAIDLAIVTHNDDDHIGGFADLISNKTIIVDTFLFNCSSYIDKLFPTHDSKLSLRQDRKLQEHLLGTKIRLIGLHNEPGNDSLVKLSFKGFEFSFLSPNEEKLERYKKHIDMEDTKVKLEKFSKMNEPTCVSRLLFNELMSELTLKDDFIEDKSPANGTSLAFNLQIGCKNFLFLGDSHPSLVASKITCLEAKTFDLCKLSHHGSERNTSQELLSKITCKNFLICGNGSSYGHPSLLTIARVLLSEPEARFYFSSNSAEINKLTNSIQLRANLAHSGFLKVEYEC